MDLEQETKKTPFPMSFFAKIGEAFSSIPGKVIQLKSFIFACIFFGALLLVALLYYFFRYHLFKRYAFGNYTYIRDYFNDYYDDMAEAIKEVYEGYVYLEDNDVEYEIMGPLGDLAKENCESKQESRTCVETDGIVKADVVKSYERELLTSINNILDDVLRDKKLRELKDCVDKCRQILKQCLYLPGTKTLSPEFQELMKLVRQSRVMRNKRLPNTEILVDERVIEDNLFEFIAELWKIENLRHMYERKGYDVGPDYDGFRMPIYTTLFGLSHATIPPMNITNSKEFQGPFSALSPFARLYVSFLGVRGTKVQEINFMTMGSRSFFTNPDKHPWWGIISNGKTDDNVMTLDEFKEYIEGKIDNATTFYANLTGVTEEEMRPLVKNQDWDAIRKLADKRDLPESQKKQRKLFDVVGSLQFLAEDYYRLVRHLQYAYKLYKATEGLKLREILKNMARVAINKHMAILYDEVYKTPDDYLVFRYRDFVGKWVVWFGNLWGRDYAGHIATLWVRFAKFNVTLWEKGWAIMKDVIPVDKIEESLGSFDRFLQWSPFYYPNYWDDSKKVTSSDLQRNTIDYDDEDDACNAQFRA